MVVAPGRLGAALCHNHPGPLPVAEALPPEALPPEALPGPELWRVWAVARGSPEVLPAGGTLVGGAVHRDAGAFADLADQPPA
jgi:hypothetical protein